MTDYKYLAFISYKREDERWAKWLQHKLEHYRLPSIVRKEKPDLPIYARPVCKDTTDLEPGRLAEKIGEKLSQSRYLIVICSSKSARSEWVDKEVSEFLAMGRADRIIPFIIDGVPNAADATEECFPPALKSLSGEQELLGANINEMGKDAAAVKCVARMFDLGFDTLWQRHERESRRRRRWTLLAAMVVALIAGALALFFHSQNSILLENQSRAVAQTAMQLIEEGDIYTAKRLVLEVLPQDVEHPSRPIVPEAEAALRATISQKQCGGWRSNARLLSNEWRMSDIAYSDFGNKVSVAVTYPENKVYQFDAHTGMLLDEYAMGPDGEPNALVDVHNSIFMASEGGDLLRTNFDGFWGRSHIFNTEEAEIELVDVATNGVLLAMAGSNGEIIISRAEDQENEIDYVELGRFDSGFSVHDISLSPSGGRLLLIEGDKYRPSSQDLRVFDVCIGSERFGECINSWRAHDDIITAVDFFPEEDWIITGAKDGCIRIWNIINGNINYEQHYDSPVSSLDFCLDSARRGLAIGFEDGDAVVTVDDVNSSAEHHQQVHVGDNPITKIKFNGIYQFCAISSSPYNTTMEDEVRIFNLHRKEVYEVDTDMSIGGGVCQFSHDDQYLYISSSDGDLFRASLYEFGYYSDVEVETIERVDWFDDEVKTLDYGRWFTFRTNPVNEIIAAHFGHRGEIRLYNPETEDLMMVGDANIAGNGFSFSRDGSMLAYISYYDATEEEYEQYYISIVDVHTGVEVCERINLDIPARHVELMPDNSRVLVTCDKRGWVNASMVMVYDIESGEMLDFVELVADVESIDISPDGNLVALAIAAKIQIFDTKTMALVQEMKGHTAGVEWVEFSPDGKSIASAAMDSTLRVWNIERGCEMLREQIDYYEMGIGAFSKDGHHIAFPGRDNKFHIVEYLPLQELIEQQWDRVKYRELTYEERSKYYLEDGRMSSSKILQKSTQWFGDIDYAKLINELLMLLAAIAPVVLLIYYIRRRDAERPEPIWQIVKAFLLGIVSIGISLCISTPFGELGLYPSYIETPGDGVLTAFFAAAIPEEIAKFVMLWLLLRKNRHFDENMDGIVYAVCVSMGFACVENIMYVFSSEDMWFHTSLSRALFAVPGHFAFAVLMGYYYSLSRFSTTRRKFNRAMILAAPILAHGIYDGLLMVSDVAPAWSFLLLFAFFAFCRSLTRLCRNSIQAHTERDKAPDAEN